MDLSRRRRVWTRVFSLAWPGCSASSGSVVAARADGRIWPVGTYVGVSLAYAWMALVVTVGFRYSGWADRAAEMMAERGAGDECDASTPDE